MTGLRAETGGTLRGRIRVPGDKSISHRALILSGLAAGRSRIRNLLEGEDVLATAAAVRSLGATVEQRDGEWMVEGRAWQSPPDVVDCGNSGTGVRLLMGAVAAFPIEATFTGDESLRSRPMRRVTDPLSAMGAVFEGGDRLPIRVRGGSLTGIEFDNHACSAQVKSAILLAGLGTQAPVAISERLRSRDHSERMLSAFGVDVETIARNEGALVRLGRNRRLKAVDIEVPGDPSSAAFPLVAALLAPDSEITVCDLLLNPLRTGLFETLQEMGAPVEITNRRQVGGEEIGDVTTRSTRLRAVEVPASRAPSMIDEYPILAAAAAFAQGRTIMHGLSELRVKESDRLQAIIDGLKACGVEAGAQGDSLWVEGGSAAGGGKVATHGDHRIAMSFLVLGLASKRPVSVDRPDMIATSFPGFPDLMRSLGARIEETGE